MMRREVMLETLKRTDSYSTKAKLRLRFKDASGVVSGSDLHLEATLSDELSERIRFEVEQEVASLIGDDVETFSNGQVVKNDDDDLPF
jgi:hypothetical protein